MAESVDLPFDLTTWVGRMKHKFNRIRQVAPKCPHGTAHWRHMANTIKPSVCGGNAALCQSILTIYIYYCLISITYGSVLAYFWPHRSTTNVDVVVCRSVGLFVKVVSPAKNG